MDLTEFHAAHPAHKHDAPHSHERGFPVVLVISFLVLSACAAFAIVMTNGLDGRASAEAGASPQATLGVADDPSVVEAPVGSQVLAKPLQFRASLSSGPLVIGESGTLVITVINPNDTDVALQGISVDVLPPAEEGCRPEWLDVGTYPGDTDPAVVVTANGTQRVTVPYTLVNLPLVNQDACKGAAFPLSITGSGRAV